ncbi:hypothetical protein A3J20_01215 [Candidatus Gottesmanbacteria bacterium RIFCSPLOWO2_02_FULL_42_29]|nr:MAG: hypothetical protein UV46_C0067G0004 [Candidatus Gottesmanbacteria bacterium GW2011_GWC2_42_8]OGG10979.1 MAG: hypothetical protein A2781_05940 [Candidatus Gottesmanbacteria bacterium RIFCSPHIGHO2_01_FULL_42_27]OGG20409.1 MAG: hypothetical protein A3E72_06370 [Candidatus Gottesmanbacteria bacterium RIFCSPHIGHO2_12_FULL_43_26]OGG39201.1 MAG: hypothetical protein A3J20_01215 [Candidatus Gottesmanbacteria bacterium RIFCSPLOWO2_02_FULL_42_29]
MKIIQHLTAIFFITLMVAFIVLPLLLPGYIIALDLPMGPNYPAPMFSSADFLSGSFFSILGNFIPSFFLHKFLLILTFFTAAFGMYFLIPSNNLTVRLLSGLIYIINPFVYQRLVAGQWLLMFGYALLPWSIVLLQFFLRSKKFMTAVFLALFWTLLATVSLHFFFIAAIFFLIYLLAFLILEGEQIGKPKDFLLKILGFLIIFLLLNANWLTGFIIGNDLSASLSLVTREELMAFRSVADPKLGVLFNLLSGYGFWPELYKYYLLPKQLFPLWPAVTLGLLSLSILGFIKELLKRKNTTLLVALALFFLLGLDLAIGIASPHLSQSILWFYEKIPILRGFREPQKLVSAIFLFYAFFAPLGLSSIFPKISGWKQFTLSAVLILLLIFNSLPLFWGFYRQLKPVFYPEGWQKVNKVISDDKGQFLTLFFPWHHYLKLHFNNNIVSANPAVYFFKKPVISAQNLENISLSNFERNPETLHVEGLLAMENTGKNLLGENVDYRVDWSRDLSPIDVKYIILAKDADWHKYQFLDKDADFVKEYEDDSLILYRNLSFGQQWEYPEPEPTPTEATESADLENLQISTSPAGISEEE